MGEREAGGGAGGEARRRVLQGAVGEEQEVRDGAPHYREVSVSQKGIAKRLVRAALNEAARKRELRYGDLNKIEKGVRWHFHDDIKPRLSTLVITAPMLP